MRNTISNIKDFKDAANDLYIESLLFPEKTNAKIPSPLPISSATASIKYNFTITPNKSGKFCLVIDPFYNQGYLYQDDTVDGQGHGTVTPINFNQDASIVDQYRLVSSGLILRYYGNFHEMAGMFIGATTSNVSTGSADTFLTFQNVEDLSNKYISKCVDGIKMIYSPMDNKATEFRINTEYSNGNHPCRWQYLFVIIGELFPNTSCIRADYYRNIEYTTKPAYREYITQTKELPSNFDIPDIPCTISAAPDPTQIYRQPNDTPWHIKILTSLAQKGEIFNPLALNYH